MSMVFAAVAVLFLVAAAFSKSDPGDPPNESSDRWLSFLKSVL